MTTARPIDRGKPDSDVSTWLAGQSAGRLRRGIPGEGGNRLGGPGGAPGHPADCPIDSAAAIGLGGALDFGLSCLLYMRLYTACVFCACCPGPMRRRKFLAQVQGPLGFQISATCFFRGDNLALSGNISKAFVLLRRGVLSSANGRLPVVENGCVVDTYPCRERSAMRRVDGDLGVRDLTAHCRDCQASARGPTCDRSPTHFSWGQ